MGRYLTKLFSRWVMTWSLREAHLHEGGASCSVLWHATFRRAEGEKTVEADGMDLVVVATDDRIQHNEVYFDRAVLTGL
jgi:hypothetical protein